MSLNKQSISYVATFLLVTLLLGITIGYAANPSATTYLYPGSMTETATYVVWAEGANYFAKNGETGQVLDSTNASDLIQYCLNTTYAITNKGTVFLKAGVYQLTNTIEVKTGVSLIGSGSQIAFPEIATLIVTRLAWAGSVGGTVVRSDFSNIYVGVIKNLWIDGNGDAAYGLHLKQCMNSIFENIHVSGATNTLITCQASNAITGNFVLNTFRNVETSPDGSCASQIGFNLVGDDITHIVTLNTFENCRFSGYQVSLQFYSYADTNTFLGGRVEAWDTNYGIIIGESNHATDIGVFQNIFYGVAVDAVDSSASPAAGIIVHHGTDFTYYPNLFTDCVFNYFVNDAYITVDNSGQVYFKNFNGYRTYDSGQYSLSNGVTTASIAHDLVTDPTTFIASLYGWKTTWCINSWNSTHVDLGFTNQTTSGCYIIWEATYDVDGAN